jgi:hypothetical protein
MPQIGHTSRELRNAQVAIRLVLRIVILCVFAMLGAVGFAGSLVALLAMSAIMSVAVGLMRREPVFDSALTYWDEAAVYGSLYCLFSALPQAAAS